MSAILDARTLAAGTVLTPDLAIIGGGPAGISLALALADSGHDILLIESGGMNFDGKGQALYAGSQSGVPYTALDGGRLRYFGGSTNHWGGWCRPMDSIIFEKRDFILHSGWPISRADIEPYYPRAQALVEAGPWVYERAAQMVGDEGPVLTLGAGGVYTSWFQFSRTPGNVLPTHFGARYQGELARAGKITPLLNANITGIRLAHDAKSVTHLDAATLNAAGAADKRFTIKPRHVVLAAGGMENARLMLASNDVMKAGVGNQNDMVGRFFADNPVPRDVATLVLFGSSLATFYGNFFVLPNGAVIKAAFAPTEAFARMANVTNSLTTVENPVRLDEAGTAAVVATAQALGVDASQARAYSLGCGMELAPDPDRRLSLSDQKDALDMPRLKLAMTISDDDFGRYRRTLVELGRQLLASRTGMLKISYSKREEWLSALDWGHHHCGTTRMSDDPKSGVVDADCKVHGIANLHVAGSSVFPSYGASNPTLNLLALTLKLGDHLKKVMA